MGVFTSWTKKDEERFQKSELKKATAQARAEGLAEGRTEGHAEGCSDTMEKMRKEAGELLSQGHTADEVLRELGLSETGDGSLSHQ